MPKLSEERDAAYFLDELACALGKRARAKERERELWRKFGVAVRREREAAGWGLEAAAKPLGITKAYLSYLETGRRAWPEEIAAAVVEVLERWRAGR